MSLCFSHHVGLPLPGFLVSSLPSVITMSSSPDVFSLNPASCLALDLFQTCDGWESSTLLVSVLRKKRTLKTRTKRYAPEPALCDPLHRNEIVSHVSIWSGTHEFDQVFGFLVIIMFASLR